MSCRSCLRLRKVKRGLARLFFFLDLNFADNSDRAGDDQCTEANQAEPGRNQEVSLCGRAGCQSDRIDRACVNVRIGSG